MHALITGCPPPSGEPGTLRLLCRKRRQRTTSTILDFNSHSHSSCSAPSSDPHPRPRRLRSQLSLEVRQARGRFRREAKKDDRKAYRRFKSSTQMRQEMTTPKPATSGSSHKPSPSAQERPLSSPTSMKAAFKQ